MDHIYSTEQLSAFYSAIVLDTIITSRHICLYMALFQQWNNNKCHNPISINRRDIMLLSKINGLATYHKCIKELNDLGYIRYFPSYHPIQGSEVYLNNISRK